MTAERIDLEPTSGPSTSRPPSSADPAVSALRDICPFLLAAGGGWRSAEATGDHRCTAVFPPAPLATEKQRRLCLTPSHDTCATFVAALAARDPAIEGLSAGTRPMPRTTPVVMERTRFAIPTHSLRPDRTAGQAALVAVLVVAFVGIILARSGSGPGGSSGAIVGSSGSPVVATPVITTAPTSGAIVPSATPVQASPSPVHTLVPTEASPPPTKAPTTYKVQRGDTLSGIAATYGTTWQVLAQLNHIKNPSALRVGTVLKLP